MLSKSRFKYSLPACITPKHAGRFIGYSKLLLGMNGYVSTVSGEGSESHSRCKPALCSGAGSGSTVTLTSYFLQLHFSIKGWFLLHVLQYYYTVLNTVGQQKLSLLLFDSV